MAVLAQSVVVDGETYAAGTTPPDAIADRIRNGAAWVGGTAPALSAPRPLRGDIGLARLTSPARALAALGLDALGPGGAVGSSNITDGTIVDADIASGAAIAQTKIAGLPAALTTKVDKGTLVMRPEDPPYNAVGDGVADDFAAVKACFDAANALRDQSGNYGDPGATVLLRGKYKLTSMNAPIDVMCNLISEGAYFSTPAGYAGIAVRIGHNEAGKVMQNLNVTAPSVTGFYVANPPLPVGSVGVMIRNVYTSDISVGKVQFFETPLWLGGESHGVVYNRIAFNTLTFGKVMLRIRNLDATGWCNQNVFLAGSITGSSAWAGVKAAGYRSVLLDGEAGESVNGNTFLGTSFEGDVSEYVIEARNAVQNQFYGSRFEQGTLGKAISVSGATFTAAAHGYSVGDTVLFSGPNAAPGGLEFGPPYYVVTTPTADTLTVSLTKGGAAITTTSDSVGMVVYRPMRVLWNGSLPSMVQDNVIDLPTSILGWIEQRTLGAATNTSGNAVRWSHLDVRDVKAKADLPVHRVRNRWVTSPLRPAYAVYPASVDPIEAPTGWSAALSDQGLVFGTGQIWTSGLGSPEGVVTAPVGSWYTRKDGTVATGVVYTKRSGTGNTGWVNVTESTGYSGERSFQPAFTSTANEKVDVYFTGQVHATFEVTVVGFINAADATGSLRAVYTLSGNSTGTVWGNTMEYTRVQGAIGAQFALTPITWDATNSRWKFTVVHRTALANSVGVHVRWLTQGTAHHNSIRDSITASAVYTTDTSTAPTPTVTVANPRTELVVDSSNNGDYATLAAALADVGSTQAEVVINSAVTLSGATTVPTNVRLGVTRTGSIALAGNTLAINGRLNADRATIFTGSGAVTFGLGAVEAAYPEWWGAKSDGTVDSGPAITKAVASIKAVGGVVQLAPGTYLVSTTIDMSMIQANLNSPFPPVTLTLRGAGKYRTMLTGGEVGYGFIDMVGSNALRIEGMSLRGTVSLQWAILAGRTTGNATAGLHRFSDLFVWGAFTVAGIFTISSEMCSYEDLRVTITAGKCIVLGRDTVGWTVTGRWGTLSTTAGYGGGNGVNRMSHLYVSSSSAAPGDYLIGIEYPQTFYGEGLYTYAHNADKHIVVSKQAHDLTFVNLHQEFQNTEPVGLYFSAANASGTAPNFTNVSLIGARMYSIYAEDGTRVSNLLFRGSFRGTKTYTVDVDTGTDMSIHSSDSTSSPSVAEISAANLKYRVRTLGGGNEFGTAAAANVTVPDVSLEMMGTRSSAETLTNKRITPRVAQAATATNINVDFDTTDQHNITAQASDLTVGVTGTPTTGQEITLRLKDNGVSRALTWAANFRGLAAALPATTTAGKTMYLTFRYNSADAKVDLLSVVTEL